MIDDFMTISMKYISEPKQKADMVVMQRTLLSNYIAYLDSDELSGSDKHARKWKEKMLREIKSINSWLKENSQIIPDSQERWI
jgi:hypothetical protein